MNHDDAWRMAQACAWYVANRSVDDFLQWFFAPSERRPNDPYVAEWAARWQTHNFAAVFNAMDFGNQRRFVAEILRAYEASTATALERAKAHWGEAA